MECLFKQRPLRANGISLHVETMITLLDERHLVARQDNPIFLGTF